VVGVDASAVPWLSSLLDDALHATVAPVPTPPAFAGALRPYQERGTGWLTFLGRLGLGACLADDMGLGKTAQLIAALLADPADGPTLVVCPVSVLGNWERELARFAPTLAVLVHHGPDRHGDDETFGDLAAGHDVVLTTYSLVARDVTALTTVDWGRLVLDEAQQVKNPGTAQTKAVQQVRAARRVALTGTPVENRLGELWSIMHVLNPGLLGSARSFRERFAVPIERDHDDDATELLRRATGPFILRRLKTDRSIISDLPDKIETVDRCPLTREQASLYQAVVDDLLAGADEAEGMSRRGVVLAGLLRLKQVCNHPTHFLADGSALGGRSGKLTRTEELLEEILSEGDKVLCFTQFTAWGDLLLPYLQRRFRTDALWLHGGVRRTERDKMVRRFEDPDGPQLFLISLKAGGTGLNLTAASHVIHLDRWWNPAVEDQATDRAYRIGQRRTVQVHKLVSSGTIEERIDEMITGKRDLAQRVVGTGEEWLTELSTDDLRDLVALRTSELA
jgi:SNF2 family DNA or RNA helicase